MEKRIALCDNIDGVGSTKALHTLSDLQVQYANCVTILKYFLLLNMEIAGCAHERLCLFPFGVLVCVWHDCVICIFILEKRE